MELSEIRTLIEQDTDNAWARAKGWMPVYTAHKEAKILLVGQAPGIRAQQSGVPWNDQSGDNLRKWMGISREVFYDATKIALIPMDFYYPGSLVRSDVPPRKGFAEKWHPLILAEMPHIELTLLVGQYAHKYYLNKRCGGSLTETVRCYREYLPEYLPLVHPSPRNNIWHKKNPWFLEEVVPTLRAKVAEILVNS